MLHCVTQTPAGWYPDPDPAAVGGSLRYWDGTAWTEHVHAMPQPATPTGPTTPDGEQLAGWWWRVLAYVIDTILVGVVTTIVSLPAQIQVQREIQPVADKFNRAIEQDPDQTPDFGAFLDDYLDILQAHAFWLVAPGVILTGLYWAIFLRWKGGTPGKLMLGLRVRLRERPGRLPWGTILVRMALQLGVIWTFYALAYATGSLGMVVVSMLVTLVMLIDPLWASWDSKRQALHDKVARTNVVRRG